VPVSVMLAYLDHAEYQNRAAAAATAQLRHT